MALTIDFTNTVKDALDPTKDAKTVSATLFGGIALSTRPDWDGFDYDDIYAEAHDALDLNFIRFPDGELPDGFAIENADGTWRFDHNELNGRSDEIMDPITGALLDSATDITTEYLQSLTPAMSLTYPELIHPDLLSGDGAGRMVFTESLKLAVETGSSYSLVLPEFQYLYSPDEVVDDGDFSPEAHADVARIKAELTQFLTDLFVNGKWNDGELPEDFIVELGNEDFFGWNTAYFDKDLDPNDPTDRDLDSYSAYAFACLEAIAEFRTNNPTLADSFKVSMQAQGKNSVNAIIDNFGPSNEYLFGEVDVIDTFHLGLDATLDQVNDFEGTWTITAGIKTLRDAIIANGGDAPDLYNSAWSATSIDVHGDGVLLEDTNHELPAAGAVLSLLSGMAELGIDYTANWGIGAFGGFGTQAVGVKDGTLIYAPHIEAYRQMAEVLPGMTQVVTATMDGGRDSDVNTYAYMDGAKAVVFMAANDFDGDTLTETVDLQGIGDFDQVWIERISTETLPDGSSNTVVTRELASSVNGSEVTVEFQKDYEVIRLVVNKATPNGDGWFLWNGDGGGELVGTAGDDTLFGGAGDDILRGGTGADRMDGGAGFDEVNYGTATGGIGVNLGTNTAWGAASGDSFTSIEKLVGSDFADTLIGDGAANTLSGGKGNDMLKGGGGDDTIYSGFGNDTAEGGDGDDDLYGYDGDDVLKGGSGNDQLYGQDGNDYLSGGTGADHHDGGAGSDYADFRDIEGGGVGVNMIAGSAWGKATGDTFTSIENIWGSLYNDKFVGTNARNIIYGGGGHDDVEGRGGNDVIYGGWGHDVLDGGDGNDYLNGGHYDDTYTGGDGADTFVFHQHDDTITDFDIGEGDTIQFHDGLWGGGAKTGQELLSYASVVDGNVVFDFGNGHTLTLTGVDTLDGLETQISRIPPTASTPPADPELDTPTGTETGTVTVSEPQPLTLEDVIATLLDGPQDAPAPAPADPAEITDLDGLLDGIMTPVDDDGFLIL